MYVEQVKGLYVSKRVIVVALIYVPNIGLLNRTAFTKSMYKYICSLSIYLNKKTHIVDMYISPKSIHLSFDLFESVPRSMWQFIYIAPAEYHVQTSKDNEAILLLSPNIVLSVRKAILYLSHFHKHPVDMSSFEGVWNETEVETPTPEWRSLVFLKTPDEFIPHEKGKTLMMAIHMDDMQNTYKTMAYHFYYGPRKIPRIKPYRLIYKKVKDHLISYMLAQTSLTSEQESAIAMSAQLALEMLLCGNFNAGEDVIEEDDPYEYLLTRRIT